MGQKQKFRRMNLTRGARYYLAVMIGRRGYATTIDEMKRVGDMIIADEPFIKDFAQKTSEYRSDPEALREYERCVTQITLSETDFHLAQRAMSVEALFQIDNGAFKNQLIEQFDLLSEDDTDA